MHKIKRITQKIRPSDGYGLFHDTRGDVNTLAKVMNEMIEKQNEIIDAVNELIEKESRT